jgi:hypothetical protein
MLQVSAAGDINGDGFDDLLIADPGWGDARAERGQVHLLLGGTLADDVAAADAHATILGDLQGDRIGQGLAPAGDVDGDGLDDVLLGAPGSTDILVSTPGKAYLFRGPTLAAGGLLEGGDADVRLPGYLPEDFTGSAVAGRGDIDGDALDDVLVGAPGSDVDAPSAGRAWLILGAQLQDQGALALNAAHTVFGGEAGDWLGRDLAFVPDQDGDARTEVLLGGAGGGEEGRGQGLWQLWSGAEAAEGGLLQGAADTLLAGDVDENAAGVRVLSVVALPDGALLASEGRFQADAFRGWAARYAGIAPPSPWPLPDLVLGWSGDPAEADHVALVLGASGDHDGDGLFDLTVAAPYVEGALEGRGRVHVFFGPLGSGPERLLDTADLILDGANEGDHLGASVGAVGDLDGDGHDELHLLAPGWDGAAGPDAGRIWVLPGDRLR